MSRKKTTGTRTGYYASSYSKDYAGRGSSMSRRPNRGPSRVKEVLIILLALLVLAAAIFGLVKLIQHRQAEKGTGLKTSSVATSEEKTANVGTARVLTDEERTCSGTVKSIKTSWHIKRITLSTSSMTSR